MQNSFAIKLSKSDNWKWVKTKISFVRGKSGHLGSVQYLDETIAFTITLRQKPRGVSRNRRRITKKRSLFYMDWAKFLWTSASGLLWTSFIQILKRRHLVSYLFYYLIYGNYEHGYIINTWPPIKGTVVIVSYRMKGLKIQPAYKESSIFETGSTSKSSRHTLGFNFTALPHL